ncbi:MAG: hypothetical protein K8T26_02860 [Lentisphaerae bacterium]|nr:hypothetical protein [Lentisphaerota bacterium]
MNTKSFLAASAGLVLLVLGGALLNSGCEEGSGTQGLTVEPAFADLTSGFTNFTQTFTVSKDDLRELSLPLTWRVSDPSLGSIQAAGGYSASYTRTKKHGDNGIFVEDQYGAEGAATVRQ